MQSLSKASAGCKELLGEVTRQQQIYQDMIKQSDEVALFQKMKTIKSDIDNLKSIDMSLRPLFYMPSLFFQLIVHLHGHYRPCNPNALIFLSVCTF
jgi:hypothetical protein